MKKILLLTAALLMLGAGAQAGARKKAQTDTNNFRYDIEYATTGADGMCLVKVWSYSSKPKVAVEQCRKNAVHGVIFKGYAAADGSTVSQRPLVKDATTAQDKAAFFQAFFADGGDYGRYVSTVTDGSMEVRKVGKQYKVGVVVTVSKDLLRKHLENAGIVRGLAAGF